MIQGAGWTSSFCIKCIIYFEYASSFGIFAGMGRPPRLQDHDLAGQLDNLLLLAGSSRKLALALGLEPSTLSRSMVDRAFASGTRAKIIARIEDVTNGLIGAQSTASPATRLKETDEEMLQILQKLYTLLPGAIAALEAAARVPTSSR
ncbi:hypothetical protein [Sphingomonas sp. SORGH_AS_0438]|uniref:hypothetical protein n=1 Tax=Sphingomonas sp. SORGH_AS_0438 TaxID=3041756 RepID=UPI002865BA60|nr:hypothetical protein [Sphingomonas sp. SORGH_AS_0438]MDR6127109.1 DNA-binding transcriptional regulator YdaS (Cro superfamily) [Sphingomonas sp. SORGH_AS_0438]